MSVVALFEGRRNIRWYTARSSQDCSRPCWRSGPAVPDRPAGFRSRAPPIWPRSVLAGGWTGYFSEVAATQYEAEGRVKLQIHEDGTFTGTITANRGANNITRAAPLKGTVIADDNRVVLQNTEGPWSTLTLKRRGNDTLYGPAFDPASEENVMLELQRDGTQG